MAPFTPAVCVHSKGLVKISWMNSPMISEFLTANPCSRLYQCISPALIIWFTTKEILCAVLLVILTHLVTCFPGIECGSEIMLEGVVAYNIKAPPYKIWMLSASIRDPKSKCFYSNSSLSFSFLFFPTDKVDVCGLSKILHSLCYCCYYHHPAYTACRGNTETSTIKTWSLYLWQMLCTPVMFELSHLLRFNALTWMCSYEYLVKFFSSELSL